MDFMHFEIKHMQAMRLVAKILLMSENGNVTSQEE